MKTMKMGLWVVAASCLCVQGLSAGPNADDEKVEIYDVSRSVSDFPVEEDFSTPESAYAAINRVMARGGSASDWSRISGRKSESRTGRPSAQEAKMWREAIIREVNVYKGRVARVFAEVRTPSGEIMYDQRSVYCRDGLWFNQGQDGLVRTLEEARFTFEIKKYRLFSIAQGSPPPPVAVLLEQGIFTEETVGDLLEAIEIYGEIVADGRASRKYVADALFRLGRCQVEEGRVAEALENLNLLVRQYPESEKLVERAGELIASLKPDPLFPELVNCRLKYTLEMVVGNDVAKGTLPVIQYPGDLSQVIWSVAPELERRIDHFRLFLVPDNKQKMEVEYGARLAADSRSVPPQSVEAEHIGRHTVRLVAYGEGGDELARSEQAIVVKPAMYSQLSVNDILPSGDICFSSAQQIPGVKQKITTEGFINSDFVHIEKMFDVDGNEMEFTEKHQGSIYRYRATLNEPVHIGETLFLGTSGTKETLVKKTGDKTFRYSMNHSPSVGRPTRRVEIYRLPKGAELVSTNPGDLPHRVLEDGRIELMVNTVIPAGGSLLTEFKYQYDAPEESFAIQPAPWKDGEVLEYRLLMKTGMDIGRQFWMANSATHDDKECWEIEQRLVVPINNTIMYSRVVAEKESFAPITGWTKHQLGNVTAAYAPGVVTLNKGDSEWDVKTDGIVYDNEQAMYLMRRLPLAEGYRASFPIMSVLSGSAGMEVRIKVVGREDITVPAGTFDCWHVDLAVFSGSIKAVNQQFWLAVDGQSVVKIDAGHLDMELVGARRETTMILEDHGLHLTLPDDWMAYELPTSGTGSEIIRLLPPEMKLTGMLCKTMRQPVGISISEIMERDAETQKGYFQGYTVRESTMAEKDVNGGPCKVFAADYEDKEKAMVEYRAYFVNGSKVFWFVFRMDADQFDGVKAELDELVRGLTVDQ